MYRPYLFLPSSMATAALPAISSTTPLASSRTLMCRYVLYLFRHTHRAIIFVTLDLMLSLMWLLLTSCTHPVVFHIHFVPNTIWWSRVMRSMVTTIATTTTTAMMTTRRESLLHRAWYLSLGRYRPRCSPWVEVCALPEDRWGQARIGVVYVLDWGFRVIYRARKRTFAE